MLPIFCAFILFHQLSVERALVFVIFMVLPFFEVRKQIQFSLFYNKESGFLNVKAGYWVGSPLVDHDILRHLIGYMGHTSFTGFSLSA